MIIFFAFILLVKSQIIQKLQQTDFFTLLHNHNDQEIFQKIQNQLKDILTVKYIDCQKSADEICKKNETIYVISKNQQAQFEDELSYNKLLSFVKSKIPDQSSILKDKSELDVFLDGYQAKFILFTNKKEAGTIFKYISYKFRKQFQFGIILEENKELIQKYNIQQFPQLVLLNKDFEFMPYKGQIDVENISEFLTNKENLQKINNFDDFTDYILQEESIILVNVFKKGDKIGSMKQIQSKFGRMIKYIGYEVYDKQTEQFAKNTFKISKLPQLIYYPFSIEQKQNQQKLDNNINIEDFIDIVKQTTLEEVTYLSPTNFEKESNQALDDNKMLLILFIQKDMSLSYKVLSQMQQFKSKVFFAAFQNAPADVCQRFGVDKFPSLAIMSRQQGEKDKNKVSAYKYPGKIHYDELTQFFYQVSGGQLIDKKPEQLKVQRVQNQEQFLQQCQSLCIIGLLDGSNKDKLLQQSLVLKNLRQENQSEALQFIQIDGVCHSEIKTQIEIDQIPYLFVYQPSKNKVFPMFGTFEIEGLNNFIKKVISGKSSGQNIQDKIKLDNKNCQDFYQKQEL